MNISSEVAQVAGEVVAVINLRQPLHSRRGTPVRHRQEAIRGIRGEG